MVTRLRNGQIVYPAPKNNLQQKVPSRNQLECSPQQAKEKVESLIGQGKLVMVVLRGLPGSGKSSIAKEIKLNGKVLSTDEFFVKDGKYTYDHSKLAEAHAWNQRQAKIATDSSVNPIVIDNTHTLCWEMKYYVCLAQDHDYHVEIIEPSTAWKFNPRQLSEKNTHDVPMETIQRMLERYERNVSVERVVGDTKKELPKTAIAADPESGEKKPRKRRRRRRRRRKKQADDAVTDSDKGDQTSDDDLDDKRSLENGLNSDSANTDTPFSTGYHPRPKLAFNKRVSSSSMESEEPCVVDSTLKEAVDGKVFDAEPEGSTYADLNNSEHRSFGTGATTNSPIAGPSGAVEAVGGDRGDQPSSESAMKDEEEILAADGLVLSPGEIPMVPCSARGLTEARAHDDLELDAIGPEQSLADHSPDMMLIKGSNLTITATEKCTPEVVNLAADERVGDELVLEQVKAALRQEVEMLVREQIISSLVDGLPLEFDVVTSDPATGRSPCQEDACIEASNCAVGGSDEVTVEKDAHDTEAEEQVGAVEQVSRESEKVSRDSDVTCSAQTEPQTVTANSAKLELKSETVSCNDVTPCDNDAHVSTGVVQLEDSVVKTSLNIVDSCKEERCADKQTLTTSSDRAAVYRLLNGSSQVANNEMCNVHQDFNILSSKSRDINSSSSGGACQNTEFRSSTMRDQACTADLVDDAKVTNDLVLLQSCFPDADVQYLEHFLAVHEGDIDEAVIDLMDAGLIYQHPDVIVTSRGHHDDVSANHAKTTDDKDPCNVTGKTSKTYSEAENKAISAAVEQLQPLVSRAIQSESDVSSVQPDAPPKNGLRSPRSLYETCSRVAAAQHQEQLISNNKPSMEENRDKAKLIKPEVTMERTSVMDSTKSDTPAPVGKNPPKDTDEQQNSVAASLVNQVLEGASAEVLHTDVATGTGTRDHWYEGAVTVYSSGLRSPRSLYDLCIQLTRGRQVPDEVFDKLAVDQHFRLRDIEAFQECRLLSATSKDDALSVSPPAGVTSSSTSDSYYDCLSQSYDKWRGSSDTSAAGGIPVDDAAEAGQKASTGSSSALCIALEVDETLDEMLMLSPDLAQQLIDLFGPVARDVPTEFTMQNLEINLTRQEAKAIHKRWSITLTQKYALEQASRNKFTHPDACDNSSSAQRADKSKELAIDVDEGQANFAQIMQDQYYEQAIEESRQAFDVEGGQSSPNHFASRMKKQKLYDEFPEIDRAVVSDTFAQSGCSLVESRQMLTLMYGRGTPVINVFSEAYDSSSGQGSPSTKRRVRDVDSAASGDTSSVSGARLLLDLHGDYRQKVLEAIQSGDFYTACFHSKTAYRHIGSRKDSSNTRSSNGGGQSFGGDVIDLHGMQLSDAISMLKMELSWREDERKSDSRKRRELRTLEVITGQGLHSRGGAVLRPAILRWLEQKHYTFDERKAGSVEVTLK